MVGSPNYVRFIYDGDGSRSALAGPAGLGGIEKMFEQFFADRELAAGPRLQRPLGLPGLHPHESPSVACSPVPRASRRGAGRPLRRHRRRAVRPLLPPGCDTIDNVSETALDINIDAMAFTLFLYATEFGEFPTVAGTEAAGVKATGRRPRRLPRPSIEPVTGSPVGRPPPASGTG